MGTVHGDDSTKGNVVIVAGNDINNQGSKISSTGSTLLEATDGDVNITTSTLRNRTEESGGSKKKRWEKTTDNTTNLQSEITSGEDLHIISGDDTLIQAAKIESAEDITINTGDNLILATATNSNFFQEKRKNKTTFTFKNSDKGAISTTIINNEIIADSNNDSSGSLTFNVGSNALAQYNSKDWSDTNASAPQKLDYLNDLKEQITSDKLTLSQQQEFQKSWDEMNRGLTQTSQIVIAVAAVAVAVGTGGIGSGISGAMMTAAATTAATTATTSAVTASMNADGSFFGTLDDVGKTTFKDTTSKESLQNIAVSAAAAGLAQGATQASGLNKISVSSGATVTERLATNTAIAGAKIGINATSYALANSAIKGESFSDSIKDQDTKLLIAQLVGEVGAKEIGRAAHTNKTDANGNIVTDSNNQPVKQIDQPTQLALHGALGCALSAGAGGNCASGAVAGIASEYIADKAYNNGYNATQSIAIGQGVGAISSLITSAAQNRTDEQMAKDTQLGGFVGVNAVQNNLLMPQEKKELVKELDSCNGDPSCKQQVQQKYEQISNPRDEEFNKLYDACKSGNQSACSDFKAIHYDLRNKLTEEGNSYYLAHKDEFKLLPPGDSVFHTWQRDPNTGEVINVLTGRETGVTKYVHPIMGYEVVLDVNKNIVIDPLNVGTYNFYNPNLGVGNSLLEDGAGFKNRYFGNHAKFDVKPYFDFGNAPNPIDPTTSQQRSDRKFNYLLGGN